MSDIVLVQIKSGMDIGSSVAPPHGLLCVAAPLDNAGYKVKIIDQRVNPNWKQDLLNELNTKPIYVGITAMTGTQVNFAIEVAKIVRQQGKTPIVWGGAHPTLLPQQVMDSGYADYVVQREADEAILDITQNIAAGRQIEKIIDCPLPDMEKLLPTPWHLIDVEKYIHKDIYVKNSPRTMDVSQTSRHCCWQCGFCSSASIGFRKWRPMSAEKSINMITTAVKKFNLSGIWLRDDEFYVNSDRAAKIVEGIMSLNIHWYTSGTRVDVFNKTPDDQIDLYKRAGAHTLKFGAESGNSRILKLMNKGITPEDTIQANFKIKKHGITPAFALMCGFPTETFEEMNDTIELANTLKRHNPMAQFETMAVYTALPGTPMWDLAIQNGLKPPTKLEEWGSWIFDEYDYEGRRIPWFNSKDRLAIGNICYLSMLSNALPNVLDSLERDGWWMKSLYKLPHKYFQWRFKNKLYRNAPELLFLRWLRSKMFYQGHMILR
jgi:anaerobic magnesium-protoporphyrin IX monomethyl ester cyclase